MNQEQRLLPSGDLRCGAVVLAGGASRRMGRPKAQLPFGDRSMLEHVVAIMQQVASKVVVAGSLAVKQEDGCWVPSRDVAIIQDRITGRGPIEGLAVGLASLAPIADLALAVACDTPLVTADFFRRLVAGYATEAASHQAPLAVVVRDAKRLHPLPAVYDLRALPLIEQAIERGSLRMGDLAGQLTPLVIPFEQLIARGVPEDALTNVNDEATYRSALATWRARQG